MSVDDWTDDDEAFNGALARNIAVARKGQRLTQPMFANRAGLALGAVRNIEQGHRRIGLDLLQQLADGLAVPATQLLPKT